MSRTCAYCGNPGKITGEHVFSECLLDRTSTIDSAQIAVAPEKYVGPDLEINDVCEECNNEKLGDADEYICEMYDKYFSSHIRRNEVVNFEYDFELLARWLLKTSYNSSRAYGRQDYDEVLSKYKNSMIGLESIPSNVLIFVLPVVPYRVKKGDPPFGSLPEASFSEEDDGTYLHPEMMGSKSITFDKKQLKDSLAYLVIINSYFFVLALLSPGSIAREQEAKLLMDANLQVLPRHHDHKDLGAPGIDIVDAAELFELQSNDV